MIRVVVDLCWRADRLRQAATGPATCRGVALSSANAASRTCPGTRFGTQATPGFGRCPRAKRVPSWSGFYGSSSQGLPDMVVPASLGVGDTHGPGLMTTDLTLPAPIGAFRVGPLGMPGKLWPTVPGTSRKEMGGLVL